MDVELRSRAEEFGHFRFDRAMIMHANRVDCEMVVRLRDGGSIGSIAYAAGS